MRFAYYNRLSSSRKSVYRQSDAITQVRLPRAAPLQPLARQLEEALIDGDRGEIERVCQELSEGITTRLEVPPVRVVVHAVRPSHDWGELHGLYEPEEGGNPPKVSLWMRTAQRAQMVAYRTFLRTLLHELCHHFDYELFDLPESFHNEGFYKRESSLFHQLVPKG